MNEERYKAEHLQNYRGILTSLNAQNGRFKMELKLEDNPVLKKSVETIEPSIELDFYYNYDHSTLFFHDIHSCSYNRNENCPECQKMRDVYNIFQTNIYHLKIGDTFKIKAALINNDWSELPRRNPEF